MENLEKRLEALYIQKNKIEEEIELLVGQIKEEKENSKSFFLGDLQKILMNIFL